MNLYFLNPPVLSTLEERQKRAREAIKILGNREKFGFSPKDNRWRIWVDMHKDMIEALTVENLLQFQSHPVLGPSIVGGSGRHFLSMIARLYGQSKLNFLLRNHTETLCGKPQDLVFEQGAYITVTSMRHLYHLSRLQELSQNYFRSPIDFWEIGGGFGNLARMICQYNLCNHYYIVDHPVMHAIQYFFLSEFFSPSDIAIVSENGDYLSGSSKSKIQLYSSFKFNKNSKIKINKPFALVSTMALTEIPREYQDDYLNIFSPRLIYIFGQLANLALSKGRSALNERFSNEGLLSLLGERYHTIEYKFHGYHFEYIGRANNL